MISITTATQYSGTGMLIIKEGPESEIDQMPARVQVDRTLDGGVVVLHHGFSHGDRPINIRARLTEEESDIIKAIHQNHTMVSISMKDGFFSGAITYLRVDGGELDMDLVLEEKLSS